ncbi:MAG: NifU family protein [Bacteroidota bacterium]
MTASVQTKYEQVLNVLPKILPAMQADGGGLEVSHIEEDIVYVKMLGACTFCPSVSLTMKLGIERTLKEHLSWVVGVRKI